MKRWISPDTEKYLGVGLQLAASVLLGFFAGFYIDRRFKTGPWGMLIGFMAGLLVGFAGFILQVKGLKTDSNDEVPPQ